MHGCWGMLCLATTSHTMYHRQLTRPTTHQSNTTTSTAQSINQSISYFLKWPKWHSHCKDHWLGKVSKLNHCRNKKNVLTVDEKSTVNLQRRRQLAVCSRCREPQPQKLGCRLLTASLAVPRDGWCWQSGVVVVLASRRSGSVWNTYYYYCCYLGNKQQLTSVRRTYIHTCLSHVHTSVVHG